MSSNTTRGPIKIASLSLPTRETQMVAQVFPTPQDTLLFLGEFTIPATIRQPLLLEINQVLQASRANDLENSSLESKLENILVELNTVLSRSSLLLGNPLSPHLALGLVLLKERQLALATLGRIGALVISRDTITSINQSHTRAPVRIAFSELSSGQLEADDNFLLFNNTLFDFYSPEKLKTVFKNHAPGLALREIERTTATLLSHPPLGVIAVQCKTETMATDTKASVDKMLHTQNKTALLLKPRLWPKVSNWLRKSATIQTPTTEQNEVTEIINPEVSTPEDELNISTEIVTPETTNDEVSLKLLLKKNTPPRSPSYFKKISHYLRACKNKLAWLKSPESAQSFLSFYIENKLRHFEKFPLSKKIALILSLILLIAFSQSIVSIGKRQAIAVENARLTTVISNLTTTQAGIEGALIYHDVTKARMLWQQGESLITELAKLGPTHTQLESWQTNFELLSQRIDRRFVVENPIIWSTLPAIAKDDSWLSMVFIKNQLLTGSLKGESVTLNTSGQLVQKNKLNLNEPLHDLFNFGDHVIIKADHNWLFDPASQTSQIIKNLPPFIDGGTFENNFYFLAEKPKTIFRISLNKNIDTVTPVRWLKTTAGELTSAQSLTIDGVVYTTSGSTVEKFVLGSKRNFSLPQINPPLQGVNLIRTFSEQDYLYLINQSAKRLIVIDKTGHLLMQINLPTLSSLQDIAVDANQNMYLLDGQTIYRLYLPEFTR